MYPDSYEIFNEPYEEDSEDKFDIDDCGFDADTNNCVLEGSEECDFFCPYRNIYFKLLQADQT